MSLLQKTMLTYELQSKAYVPISTIKTHIVLHNTFSRTKYTYTAQEKDETCAMHKWDVMADKFSGHYVIGRSGSIYSCMEEEYWSNHLMLPKRMNDLNKQTIAIFLSNELYLKKENGLYYAFGMTKPYNEYKGPVFEADFKGQQYWADFEELQIKALVALLKDISKRHAIPLAMYQHTTRYNPNVWREAGIFSCANVNQEAFSLPLPKWVLDKMASTGIELVG
jgi:N-acetyl-anhydromuramyl-L-alanine amidase AmpD